MNRKFLFVPFILIIGLFLAACTPDGAASDDITPQAETEIITPEPAADTTPEAAESETTPETSDTDAAVSDVIQGSVELARGACCAGGPVGEMVKIGAAFTAESADGEVESMRIATHLASCRSEAEMADAEWEPFVESKTFETAAPGAWSSFFVSVQYQDSAGNVSAVFCDDVAVEGIPPLPESN